MREILFKAKRIDNSEWVEGCYTECNGKTFIGINISIYGDIFEVFCTPVIKWFEVDPETICQFTWLYDKNGKKIWENDIVLVTNKNYCSGKIESSIGNIFFTFGTWYIGGKTQDRLYSINNDTIFQNEVVGNIFDNPELLQEEYK